MVIKKEESQRLVLFAQGLITSLESSLDIIEQLSYIQIDTISVAERSHHHILFTRNKSYQKSELQEMMKHNSIFEYWSHAAAFLPMKSYRFSLYRKNEIRKDDKFWFDKDKKVMDYVLKRIKEEGPLQSKDFKDTRDEISNWYAWKPAKIALTQLFMEGKLMISERQGFQKVFDLTERVLPEGIDTQKPTQTEYCKYLIEKAIQAHGIVTENEIGYLRKGLKSIIKTTLKQMLAYNELISVTIEGNAEKYFSKPAIINAFSSLQMAETLHILSPFDNLIIQRKRTFQLFNFDYQIECYLPEHKRTYGYFTLPLLYGQNFIGRLDPKADRKTGVFYIKSLWFENGFTPDEKFAQIFVDEVKLFAKFCGCNRVEVGKVMSNKFKKIIKL